MASSLADRRLLILFASQSGTAEDVSHRLSRDASKLRFVPVVLSIASYPIARLIDESLVLFVCSTAGHGEVPDSMRQFWRFVLRKDLPADSLSRMRYSVFGLGDSSYPIYNAAARRLFNRLRAIGAEPIGSLGLGDDQEQFGYETGFQQWKDQLWPAINQVCAPSLALSLSSSSSPLPSSFSVSGFREFDVKIDENSILTNSNSTLPDWPNSFSLSRASVSSSVRLSDSGHFQEIRLIKFVPSSAAAELPLFQPGDVAAIRIQNNRVKVNEFIKTRLSMNPDIRISVSSHPHPALASLDEAFKSGNNQKYIPSSCSLSDLFVYYLDLFGVPKRDFFESIKQFTTNEREIEKIDEFLSPSGSMDFYRYCQRERRTFVEVLEEFRGVKLPLEVLIDLIPPLLPRSFSIGASNSLEIILAVLEFRTPLKRQRVGLGSEYFRQLPVDSPVLLSVRSGSLTFPTGESKRRPLIFIGPGTGIAPFRAAAMKRQAEKESGDSESFGTISVYFGCRFADRDNLFNAEWRERLRSGAIQRYSVAVSRDESVPTERQELEPGYFVVGSRYVDSLMLDDAELIARSLIAESGIIMVAGSNRTGMPKRVRDALKKIFSTAGKMSADEAANFIRKLEAERRFQIEVW